MEAVRGEEADAKTTGEMTFTRLFAAWLRTEEVSLATVSDLPSGFCMIGMKDEGKVLFQQTGQAAFRAVSAAPDGTIWAAEKNFLWRWENVTETGGYRADEGRLYVPRLRIFTSDLGTRDTAVDGHGTLLMASGAYSVIGRATTQASFELVWKPPFVTNIVHEDRCGLSGLGLYDKERHCVSLWGRSDQPEGWKKDLEGGGCIMLINDGSVFCEDLCLPLAPRWHGEELYLLNAGTAEFGKVDSATKRFVSICQCPGYPTGLAFIRQWAVISISSAPPEGTKDLTLPATDSFAARKIDPFSGILLIDLRSGDIAHHAYSEDPDFRLNGIAVLPGCPLAMAAGADNPKLDNLLTAPRRHDGDVKQG